MGDPAPPRRRTHGGAGAGALALVKPLPPKAVAGRPGFTRAKRPRLQSPPATRWAAIRDHALAPSLSPGATSPIRNSKEPDFFRDKRHPGCAPFSLLVLAAAVATATAHISTGPGQPVFGTPSATSISPRRLPPLCLDLPHSTSIAGDFSEVSRMSFSAICPHGRRPEK
jgi:hypothetical protein